MAYEFFDAAASPEQSIGTRSLIKRAGVFYDPEEPVNDRQIVPLIQVRAVGLAESVQSGTMTIIGVYSDGTRTTLLTYGLNATQSITAQSNTDAWLRFDTTATAWATVDISMPSDTNGTLALPNGKTLVETLWRWRE